MLARSYAGFDAETLALLARADAATADADILLVVNYNLRRSIRQDIRRCLENERAFRQGLGLSRLPDGCREKSARG